jgi:hypothetical protein
MSERPVLSIVRFIPWGDGWRHLVACTIGHPLMIRSAYRDTVDCFPDAPVLVVAEYPTHCEVVAAHQYTALRPVVKGW